MLRAVSSGASGNSPVINQADVWANRALYQTNGNVVRFTDVGGGSSGTGGGNFLFYNSATTRWKAVNNGITLDAIDTPNTGVANTAEQQLNTTHVLIPGGVIGVFDRLRIYLSLSKSGSADTCTFRFRFGPLGTTIDPVIATTAALATTAQTFGQVYEFKFASATTIQKLGNADPSSNFSGISTAAYPAAVAISDITSVGQYLSLTAQMTTGVEAATLQDYTLELIYTDSQ